ncbi:UvrD-helicase domain-containing protein [Kitasatospora sp. NPDC048365]|uniref:UvrD-helicase domain-containing protein n=1 Tax=Kitasatospora sp. NPDC048365 TaxID=3364050 RepID=UPI00372172AE
MSTDGSAPNPTPRTTRPVPREGWRPSGIPDLEPAAWQALRDTGNVAVTAGPGAGKTEFLAQRAAYFLQTGICPQPQHILAISFKRDAAANLGRRVAARVPEHSDRFESMTFDAFTKGLVDRFAAALPPYWRMNDGYDIRYVKDAEARAFLNDMAASAPARLRTRIASMQPKRFMTDVIGRWDLPAGPPDDSAADATAYTAHQWWRARHLRSGIAFLDFTMINRLAELLVRTVPAIGRALRLTYPIVFVDEFQDTTSAQFSFLAAVFGTDTAVTAVGDGKQRIMGFAGALPDALGRFSTTFNARTYPLEWNFRSAEPLVQLQHVIADNLAPGSTRAVSKATAEEIPAPAELWTFPNPRAEADHIARWIARDIAQSHRTPADFALIARQRVETIEPWFRDALAPHGIRLRNDDAKVGVLSLQDLLKDDIARLLLGLLRLADQPDGLAAVWRETSAVMLRINGSSGDEAIQRHVGEHLAHLTTQLRTWLRTNPPSATAAGTTVAYLLGLIDEPALRRYVKATTPSLDLDLITDAFEARLNAVTHDAVGWSNALEEFEAADAVVLLTAHRSKSLEYHTVFFLGLDENQWWAYGQDPAEGRSTFFVGLSRARQRLIVTTTTPDARNGLIADLFTLLDDANVLEIPK